MSLMFAGCLPDNLKKWEEPQQVVAPQTGVNVAANGTNVNVPAPSGGTAPTGFNYGVTTMGFPLGKAITALTPTFTGQTGTTNTYVFSSWDSDGAIPTSLSLVGLTLNTTTGVISGTPTSFPAVTLPAVYKIKAYHVQSGTTVNIDANISISVATDFNASGFKLVYPQANGQKLVIKVADSTPFDFDCSPSCYISNAAGAKATIDYVNDSTKELFVSYVGPTIADESVVFAIGDSVDNRDTFVSADTTISQVIYSVDVDAPATALPIAPYFTNRPSDTELGSYVEWSINPAPVGGIVADNSALAGQNLQFIDGSDVGGSFDSVGTVPINTMSTTTYTVIAKNAINQTKTLTIAINMSHGPNEMSYSNQVLLTVDDNNRFKLGSPISSSGTGKGTVIRKAGSTLVGVRISEGEFKVDDRLDDAVAFNTERAVVSAVAHYNAIFKINTNVTEYAVGNCVRKVGDTAQAVVSYVDSTNPKTFTLSTGAAGYRLLSPGYLLTTDSDDQGYVDFIDNAGTIHFLQTLGSVLTATDNVFIGTDNTTSAPTALDTIAATPAPSEAVSDIYVRFVEPADAISFSQTAATLPLESCAAVAKTDDPSFIITPYAQVKYTFANNSIKKGFYLTTATPTNEETGSVAMVINDSNIAATDTATDAASEPINVNVVNGILPFGAWLDDQNPYTAHAAGTLAGSDTIGSIAPLNTYVAYRGEKFLLTPSLSEGENLAFYLDSASDILPAGLTLNTTTGVISGTATESSATKKLILKAENSIGSSSATIKLRVIDRFAALNLTDNASSFHMHQSGKGNMNTACQITSDHINLPNNSTNEPLKDITCLLEAGELDLYFSGLKLATDIGRGLCEYVNISPYYFYQYPYKSSSENADGYKLIEKFTIPSTCAGKQCTYTNYLGVAQPAQPCDDLSAQAPASCDSDYSKIIGTGHPNCDDGSFRDVTYTILADDTGGADAGTDCGDQPSEVNTTAYGTETSCGGKRANCIDGPVTDLITDINQLDSGVNSLIYNSFEGFFNNTSNTWVFASPISKSFSSNKRLANFTHDNSCINTTSTSARYQYSSSNWHKINYYGLHKIYVDDDANCVNGAASPPSGGYNAGVIYATVDDPNDTGTKGWVYIYNPDASVSSIVNGDDVCTGAGGVVETAVYPPVNSIELNPFLGGRPFYTISCLDSAFDVKARIRIAVRDWNRTFSPGFAIDHLDLPTQFGTRFYADSDIDNGGFGSFEERLDWDQTPGSTARINGCTSTDSANRVSNGSDYGFPQGGL